LDSLYQNSVLHVLIGERVPLHIWGACGVGKSQITACLHCDPGTFHHVVFVFLIELAAPQSGAISNASGVNGLHPEYAPE